MIIVCFVLQQVDASKLYHMIRAQVSPSLRASPLPPRALAVVFLSLSSLGIRRVFPLTLLLLLSFVFFLGSAMRSRSSVLRICLFFAALGRDMLVDGGNRPMRHKLYHGRAWARGPVFSCFSCSGPPFGAVPAVIVVSFVFINTLRSSFLACQSRY